MKIDPYSYPQHMKVVKHLFCVESILCEALVVRSSFRAKQ
jgi:hypothetical protein